MGAPIGVFGTPPASGVGIVVAFGNLYVVCADLEVQAYGLD